jgi:hypothetical protein
VIERTSAPKEGSVFSPTTVKDVEETFVAAWMHQDAPPCEHVEATFGDVGAAVIELGVGDDGRIRRECQIFAGGVISDFETVEFDGCATDDSSFGSRPIDARTLSRIRRWAEGHGLTPTGPATTEIRIAVAKT